jgi:RNAse (barnase) inhibitor barstar
MSSLSEDTVDLSEKVITLPKDMIALLENTEPIRTTEGIDSALIERGEPRVFEMQLLSRVFDRIINAEVQKPDNVGRRFAWVCHTLTSDLELPMALSFAHVAKHIGTICETICLIADSVTKKMELELVFDRVIVVPFVKDVDLEENQLASFGIVLSTINTCSERQDICSVRLPDVGCVHFIPDATWHIIEYKHDTTTWPMMVNDLCLEHPILSSIFYKATPKDIACFQITRELIHNLSNVYSCDVSDRIRSWILSCLMNHNVANTIMYNEQSADSIITCFPNMGQNILNRVKKTIAKHLTNANNRLLSVSYSEGSILLNTKQSSSIICKSTKIDLLVSKYGANYVIQQYLRHVTLCLREFEISPAVLERFNIEHEMCPTIFSSVMNPKIQAHIVPFNVPEMNNCLIHERCFVREMLFSGMSILFVVAPNSGLINLLTNVAIEFFDHSDICRYFSLNKTLTQKLTSD